MPNHSHYWFILIFDVFNLPHRCYVAKSYHQLFELPHHEFGKWCIHIAISSVVSFATHWFITAFFNLNYFWNYFVDLSTNTNQRIPFDWNNPIGYLFAVIWQTILTFPIIAFLVNVVSMGIGCFLFMLAFAEDWICDMRTLDEMARTTKSKTDMIKQITEFVRSHSNFKELG